VSVIRMRNVTVRYGGRAALDDFDVEVPKGVICGWIGPNGAGKTTALGVISGYVLPEHGEVEVLGGPPTAEAFRGRVGVMPQDAEMPLSLSARQWVHYLGSLTGLTADDADRALGQVGMLERADDRMHALSHGMRRRVAVATALVGSPELVLLDEPLAGLDPIQAAALRDTIASLRGHATVVVSSHQLSELERVADYFVMARAGRCQAQLSADALLSAAEASIWTFEPGVELDLASLAIDDLTVRALGNTYQVQGSDPALAAWMAWLAARGHVPRRVERGRSLEAAVLAMHTS